MSSVGQPTDATALPVVVVESPYAGDIERNIEYAKCAVADCIRRGESPYASHLLLTQDGVLDDDVPADRELGLRAGWAMYHVADLCVVYMDLGVSPGMGRGIREAISCGVPVEVRSLAEWRR